METDIPYKWKAKGSRGGYIYITQNICQHKRHNSDKESHYTIIRRSVHQGRYNNHNICALNIGAPKCTKKILTSEMRHRQLYNNSKKLQHL